MDWQAVALTYSPINNLLKVYLHITCRFLFCRPAYEDMELSNRQQHLSTRFLFKCQCEACVNNWPTFLHLRRGICEIVSLLQKVVLSYSKMVRGDTALTRSILITLVQKAEFLEVHKPCMEFAVVQECIMRCLTMYSNKIKLL